MAEVKIDSAEIRDNANKLGTVSTQIKDLFAEMLGMVDQMSQNMSGKTIEEQYQQFKEMQDEFDGFSEDVKEYSDFLIQVAERFEAVEDEGSQHAQEQGQIF